MEVDHRLHSLWVVEITGSILDTHDLIVGPSGINYSSTGSVL